MQQAFGYARVSTREQNLDRQILALCEYVEERNIITDKASGKNFDRDGYRMLKERLLREGDTLYIKSIDRLGRNTEEIKRELQYFQDAGILVKILDLPTTMEDYSDSTSWVFRMVNNVLIEVFASMAEAERETILRRQREGIDAAKARGEHLGRRRIEYPSDWARVYGLWRGGSMTAVQAMDALGLKPNTFYRMAKRWEADASD